MLLLDAVVFAAGVIAGALTGAIVAARMRPEWRDEDEPVAAAFTP